MAAEEFAPPGDDEAVRQLAEAMAEVSSKDRNLRKKVLAELSPNPEQQQQQGEGAEEGPASQSRNDQQGQSQHEPSGET